ncbi:putative receptor protein kinase TMK1-like [Trifolium medium]|uniref:Putative receptor protein kinase TMK1-like n=1 Tax=Trifolium medium TaxID=97028 RepID=A0A392NRE5_9FABA|nr:putative receptor protein kinase TMK1-like [Trifolium medium]
MAAIDPALEVTEETFESISTVAELAGHCTAREANHRPDMGHAVKVLSELVEKWRPVDEEFDYSGGVDFGQPLPQLLKIWKEADSKDFVGFVLQCTLRYYLYSSPLGRKEILYLPTVKGRVPFGTSAPLDISYAT